MRTRLFRSEVLLAQENYRFGSIIIQPPRVFTFLTAIIAALVLAIVVLLFVKEYTRKVRVDGILVPDSGLVKVYPEQVGKISRRYVEEGQPVKAGDVLFSLSREQHTQLGPSTKITKNSIEERRNSLEAELRNQKQIYLQTQRSKQGQILDLIRQQPQLQQEILNQKQRIKLAEAAHAKFVELAKLNFAPELQVQQHAAEILSQQARLASLNRDAIELESSISATRAELKSLPLREVSQREQIMREIETLNEEALSSEARRELLITSPIAGTVAALQGEPGQLATSESSLASIIPKGSSLVAQFLAPSSAIGFIRPGQKVQLRYHSYPYQKFGQQEGIVTKVSRSAVGASGGVKSGFPETFYRVSVVPKHQSIIIYGKKEPLVVDMQLDADILVDRRRLIEWALEPLLSIKGSF